MVDSVADGLFSYSQLLQTSILAEGCQAFFHGHFKPVHRGKGSPVAGPIGSQLVNGNALTRVSRGDMSGRSLGIEDSALSFFIDTPLFSISIGGATSFSSGSVHLISNTAGNGGPKIGF